MERQLATIRQINAITSIPNADAIVLATIDGWKCVVKKDEFQVNDTVVFIEVDSILPKDNPVWAFMAPKFRIKTVRLRGQISQGLVFPLDILPAGTDLSIGNDVTEILGIELYEPDTPQCLRGLVECVRPGWIPRSDQLRVQNIPEIFDIFAEETFCITEKLDGTAGYYVLRDGRFLISSRKMCYKNIEENKDLVYVKIANDLGLEDKIKTINNDLGIEVCLQGEIVGPGVQKNRLKLAKLMYLVYDIYDVNNQSWFSPDRVQELAKLYALDVVPMVDRLTLDELGSIEDMILLTNIKSKLNPKANIEGLVFAAENPNIDIRWSKQLKRPTFKCINPDYLIKNDC